MIAVIIPSAVCRSCGAALVIENWRMESSQWRLRHCESGCQHDGKLYEMPTMELAEIPPTLNA